MPIRELDSDQKHAATSTGDEVVISAGAGSGKTSLLVGRYLYLMQQFAAPMNEIAAITFTNKAADQMKARIALQVPKLRERYPDDAGLWLDVAERIHTAPISTIHAFCNAILRSHPLEAGVDPLFQVLDETTLAGMKAEAFRSYLDSRLDEDPERMGDLLRALGLRGFRRILMHLLGHRAHILTWLDTHDIPEAGELERRYVEFILERLRRSKAMLREFHALRPGGDGFTPYLESCCAALAEVRRMVEEDRMDCAVVTEMIAAVREGMRKGSRAAWEERGKPLSEVKDGVRECLDLLEMIAAWHRYERGLTARVVSRLLEEFAGFERHFLALKKSRSCLDNDDSLIETWRLLRTNPAVCRAVSRSYRHILVDEFQDTDDLQLDILRMITGNSAASLFTVGDPKQSIYRFRGADVTVFNRFAARPGVDFKSLRTNYRSCSCIIDFVNHTFGRILGTDDPEFLFEARYAEMRANRRDRRTLPDVEVAVFEEKGADVRRCQEGEYIARRALKFAEDGIPYGHMALLLRKGTQARRYEEAFLRAGIPFVNLAGGDPFAGPEAHDIANLLGWLCNPGDETLFTATLLSPFFQVSADFLYTLRHQAGRHGSLTRAFFTADFSAPEWEGFEADPVRELLRTLLSLRDRRTIRELLERAFDETGYTLALQADPIRGEESLSILDLILRAADTFENNGGSGCEFARLLGGGELASDRSASLETRSDALTIITIHKSKGMEYRVVFLADAAARPRGDSSPCLLHDELGPGIHLQTASGKSIDTLARHLASVDEKRKAIAESKRLFYVACTRAKDFLLITGGKPSKTADTFYEKDNWMGWLHTALEITPVGEFMHGCPLGHFTYRRFPEVDAREERTTDHRRPVPEGVPTPEVAATLRMPEPRPVPVRISGKPATLSPSQAEDYLACPALYRFNRVHGLNLSFSEELSGGLGEIYGQLAHRVLEHWDFTEPEALAVETDALMGRDLPGDLKIRLKESLSRFAGSDLAGEIAAADRIRREEQFAFVQDDVLIRGKMDLVASTGDRRLVVDYKTGMVRPEDIARKAERYRFQVGVYALALYRAENVIPDRLVLHFLNPGISHEIPCDRGMVELVSQTLSRMIESMDAGDFAPRRSESCAGCPYGFLCGK